MLAPFLTAAFGFFMTFKLSLFFDLYLTRLCCGALIDVIEEWRQWREQETSQQSNESSTA
jgi:hypothetical protein